MHVVLFFLGGGGQRFTFALGMRFRFSTLLQAHMHRQQTKSSINSQRCISISCLLTLIFLFTPLRHFIRHTFWPWRLAPNHRTTQKGEQAEVCALSPAKPADLYLRAGPVLQRTL